MLDAVERQCGRCYFSRRVAGRLRCVRNAPVLDGGRTRWPCVKPTDICGCFRHTDDGPIEHDHWPRNDLPIYHDALGDYCRIPLSQGKFAKVDPEDYIWLSQFRWCCKQSPDTCYAVRHVQVAKGRTKRIYMHRLIMNTPDHLVCDHINHNGFDNRKRNLRNCTTGENNANRRSSPGSSSRYLGVSWDKRRSIWVAHIKAKGKDRYLGSFDVEADAARAYDAAAWALHGVYANLNFPENYPDHPAAQAAPNSNLEIRNPKQCEKAKCPKLKNSPPTLRL